MFSVDAKDLWRMIPPEEKIEQIANAHSQGVIACLCVLVLSSVMAIALQFPWIFWGSIVSLPFIFQFAAGRTFKKLRPILMLEYLAARSAARRFAYIKNSRELAMEIVFKGKIRFIFENESDALEARANDQDEYDVWVALFTDVVVIMMEDTGGARLIFGNLLDHTLVIETTSKGPSEYHKSLEVILSSKDGKHDNVKYAITSRYPAALVVFEKKMSSNQRRLVDLIERNLRYAEELSIQEAAEDAKLNYHIDLEDEYN